MRSNRVLCMINHADGRGVSVPRSICNAEINEKWNPNGTAYPGGMVPLYEKMQLAGRRHKRRLFMGGGVDLPVPRLVPGPMPAPSPPIPDGSCGVTRCFLCFDFPRLAHYRIMVYNGDVDPGPST